MKRIVLIGLLSVMCFVATSQTTTVIDKQTDQPVGLVTFSSDQPKTSAVADAKGHVDLTAFNGAEHIEIRMLGYQTLITSYAELEKTDFQVLLIPSNIALDQVVVVGTRWNQTTDEVPSKITTMSAREIALQNPQTAADLIGNTGEVFIQKSQQGGGSPMIRGFATNRVLITVDGVRMNTAIFRSGNVQNVINIDPFATESAEVMFGPSSVIYGSDAIGGVMNFNTLTPTLSFNDEPVVSGKAVGRYSSANKERTGHFDVNVGWKKWAMVTSFSSNDYENLRMGSYGPTDYLKRYSVIHMDSSDRVVANEDPKVQDPSAYSQINMMQKVRFRPNEHWDLSYGFHYSTTSDYGRYDRHLRTRNGLPRYAEWKYGPQVWMMNNLNITHSPENTSVYDQLTVRLAQQHFEESRIDRSLSRPTRSIRVERVEAYSGNLDFYKSISARHKVFYGLEGVYNDVTSLGVDQNAITGAKAEGSTRYPQSTWSSYAAYANYQFRPVNDVMIQAGVRYNQFQLDAKFDTTFYPFPFTSANINEGATTGSLGAVFTPGETWSISANASTGFRAPNVDDIGKVFDSEPGSVVVPNPDLKAEYAYNFEVGVEKLFGDYLELEVTGYYTILQNAMVRRDYKLDGLDSIVYDGSLSQVQAIQNAAQATVYGVQAGFEAKLPAGFGLSGRSNYQLGTEELDNGTESSLRHAAPFFSIAHLTYRHKSLNMDLYSIYNHWVHSGQLPQEEQGKTEIYAADKNGNPYVPAWYTLNFKAMYQVNKNLAVSGGLENITDQRYRPYSSGLAGAGRNFVLSARVLF
ncbi:MAG: TonB-dependent receptor [Flavobacteriales bacterium]